MIKRMCEICKKEFDISSFQSFVRKSGETYTLNKCKECNKIYKHEYYLKNKEKYTENNKKYVEAHRNEINAYNRKYNLDNKEKNKERDQEYKIKNKERIAENRKKSFKIKLNSSPVFRVRRNVSKLISSYLKRNGSRKNNKSILDNLGYSIDTLKNHLENQFDSWMTWNNWGIYDLGKWNDNDQSTWTWQIDHIIPQDKLPYISMEDNNFKKCWALDNLRPLSSKQNLLKGSK
jgi:hypothetical protein